MIEVAINIAAILQPLSVPVLGVIAFGVWKLDRRVIKLETHIGAILERNERVDSTED
jgi:hypothetical protein